MDTVSACFHCGEPLPPGQPFVAAVAGEERPVCCLGCKAVAEFIDQSELGAFYRFRSQPRAGMELKPEQHDYAHFDADDMVTRYVHVDGDSAEATIDIGGMYCSACAWLLDNGLQQRTGVASVDVNPATRRAVIAWDKTALAFSQLLEAIAEIGFTPQPVGLRQQDASQDLEYRRALKRLIVAAAAGMQVMMFAVALYAGDYFGIEPGVEAFLRAVSLLVTLPIVFYSARPFFAGAWRGLRARSPGMDLPVSIAIAAAFVASTIAVLRGSGDIYFDSVAMFVLFLGATRFLEMRARHRADSFSQALAQLLPDTALRLVDGSTEQVAVDRLEVGDLISIRPGDVVPADGEIEDGHLSIDESVLSGESLPVSRDRGMAVFAGGTNRSGSATVRVTVTGASTNLAEIGRLLEKARADRPPIARLADRIASRFVIGVLLVATVTGIVWLGIDSTRVFEIVLATLVVTCPCALALATPAALAAAATHLANRGFLLVRSRILEVLRAGTTIVFDKTGTLTRGRPVVVETRLQSGQFERDYCLALAAAMEAASEHVLARAFEARQGNIEFDLRDVQPIPGKGVAASLDSVRYRIGSRPFVQELTGQGGGDNDEDVRTIVCLGSETGPLAEFVIGDELRSDAAEAITELNALGFRTAILSGDRRAAVATVARALQIDDWEAEMSPGEKLDRVAQRKAAGERVVMVGDGINDAPVLAAADASIALDAGTALARASADAIALSRRLMTVVEAALVAQRTRTIIRQNIAWAITYNVVAVPLAAAGVLSPWMAALGMSLSSLIVVLNALRLHRPGRGEKPTTSRDRAIVEASGSATT